MPRVTLAPELRVPTAQPKTLGELPTALGIAFERPLPRKAVRAIEEPKKEKDVGGRPEKYADEMANRAYELALLGCSEKVMSVALGITVETLRDWDKTRPGFSLAIREGKTLADAKVARRIYEQALEGSISHQKWWMSVRQRGRFPIYDEKTGLTVNVGSMPAVVINADDPMEAAKQYREIMRLEGPAGRTIDVEPTSDE